MKSRKGQFSKRVGHDCVPPPERYETVEYWETPRWYQFFSEPVKRTREQFRTDHIEWSCPECGAPWEWWSVWNTERIAKYEWKRVSNVHVTKTVFADSMEALDKMGWYD